MDPKDFDNIFKRKIDSLKEQSIGTPDWERMERDLDSIKDQVFDEQIKRKLEQLTVSSYGSSNWSTLYNLINTRLMRKRAVWKSKALELTFLCAFLFTLSHLGWFSEYNQDIHYASSIQQSTIEQENSQEQAIDKHNTTLPENTSLQSSLSFEVTESRENLEELNSNIFAAASIETSTPIIDETIALDETNLSLTTGGLVSDAELQDAKSLSSILSSKDNQKLSFDDEIAVFADSELKNASTIVLENDFILNTKSLNLPPVRIPSHKKNRFFAEAGMDLAYARVESALRNTSARNTPALDNSTNKLYPVGYFNLGYEFDKGTVSTGLEYQNISYSPAVSHISGQLSSTIKETEIKNIEYHVVSIPLQFTWDLFRIKSWNFKLNTGIITNTIAKVKVSASQVLITGDRETIVDEGKINLSDFPYDFSAGILDEPAGINSFFFHTRTGIQLERKLNRSTSILSNINYNYQLPILNTPSKDQINTFTVGLTVRKYLG